MVGKKRCRKIVQLQRPRENSESASPKRRTNDPAKGAEATEPKPKEEGTTQLKAEGETYERKGKERSITGGKGNLQKRKERSDPH